jgi:hypothetical protein
VPHLSPTTLTTDEQRRHHRLLRPAAVCYEAERDYVNALKQAELARDKYSYKSWCGACSATAAEDLAKRIERLQRLSSE